MLTCWYAIPGYKIEFSFMISSSVCAPSNNVNTLWYLANHLLLFIGWSIWHLSEFNGWSVDFNNQHDINPLAIITIIKAVHKIPVNQLLSIIVIKSSHGIAHNPLPMIIMNKSIHVIAIILLYHTQLPNNNISNLYNINIRLTSKSNLYKANWWIDKSFWNFGQSMTVLLQCSPKFQDSSTKICYGIMEFCEATIYIAKSFWNFQQSMTAWLLCCMQHLRRIYQQTPTVWTNMMLQNLFPIYFVQTGSIC